MRASIVLVVFLQTILTPIASALTTDVTLLSQDFASYSGVDANAPAGWTFTSIGHYTSASSSGIAPNSLQLNSSNSVAKVTYALVSNQTSETLSFWIKGNSTGTSDSTVTVTESSNGMDWTQVASYTGAAIPTTGTVMTEDLLPTTSNVQFAYTKDAGNVALDDVVITGQQVDDAPTSPIASPPAGTYNTSKSITLSSSDDSGLTPTIRYTLDGSTPDQTSQLYADTTPILVTSDTTIKAIAYDLVNNASEVSTFVYIIDTEKPIIQPVQYFSNGASINNDTPTNKDVTARITTNEPVSRPDDSWTKIDDTTFEKTYTQNIPETITVTDAAGNKSEERVIDVKGIDKELPTITFDPPNTNNFYKQPVTYAASDNVPGSTVTINGLAAPQSGVIDSSGTYTIVATDTAGNTSSPITIEVAIPIVLPVLSVQPPVAIAPLSPRSLVSTPNIATPETSTPETAKASIAPARGPDVIGSYSGRDVALSPSEEGWKLWGIAWYWYGAVASLAASGWWLFGRKYFIPSKDEF